MRSAKTAWSGRLIGGSTGSRPTVTSKGRRRTGFSSIGLRRPSPIAQRFFETPETSDYSFKAQRRRGDRRTVVSERSHDPLSRKQPRPCPLLQEPARSARARRRSCGRRAAAMERGSGWPRRIVPPAQPIRNQRASADPALSRRTEAARAQSRRLYRQRKYRPDGAGVPPGGHGRASFGRLAQESGLRTNWHPGHEPRLMSLVADGCT